MNPNIKVTYKVGMVLINRHVVNRDVLVFHFNAVYLECIPVTLNKQVTDFKIFDELPSLAFHIERMIEGRFNDLVTHFNLVNLMRLVINVAVTSL